MVKVTFEAEVEAKMTSERHRILEGSKVTSERRREFLKVTLERSRRFLGDVRNSTF